MNPGLRTVMDTISLGRRGLLGYPPILAVRGAINPGFRPQFYRTWSSRKSYLYLDKLGHICGFVVNTIQYHTCLQRCPGVTGESWPGS